MNGKLIVFEGVDGAGIETQANLLMEYLKAKSVIAEKLSYPDYPHPIGGLIHDFLYRKFDLSPASQALIHLADRAKDAGRIKNWLEEGRYVVTERYATSTMAYQGFMGFPKENSLRIAEMAGIPRPDIIIYLKVCAKTSVSRKRKEKSMLDRNEENESLMGDVGGHYEKLAAENFFGKWVVVDGEQTIEKVFDEVKKILDI